VGKSEKWEEERGSERDAKGIGEYGS